jgi:hypothetical protein
MHSQAGQLMDEPHRNLPSAYASVSRGHDLGKRRYDDARDFGVQVSHLLLTEKGILEEWGAGPLDNLLDVAAQASCWAWGGEEQDSAARSGFADGFILGVMSTGGWPRR